MVILGGESCCSSQHFLKLVDLEFQGSHAAQAYSRIDRTRPWYAADLADVRHSLMFRLMKPSVLFALLMWLFHLLMVTPMYLLELTTSRWCPCIVQLAVMGFRLLVICITTHFSRWDAICQSSSHLVRDLESRLFCKVSASALFVIGLHRRHSSVKRRASDSVLSGRSLMKRRNSKGPKTVPCGTPNTTGAVVGIWPSRSTCLVCQEVGNSLEGGASYPIVFQPMSQPLMGTLSKAFEKSSRIIST